MSVFFGWAKLDFMRYAFLALLIAAPLFALLGTHIVNSSMAFFSDAIGHSALTGIALGVSLGLKNPKIAIIIFSLVFGLAIITVKLHTFSSSDTIIGVFSSSSMALGLVLLSTGTSFSSYQKYLVGDILTIQPQEIFMLFVCAILLVFVWTVFYNKMLIITIHSVFAKSRGIKTAFIQIIFALIVALIIACCISWTGLLLINSLLVLPAATARQIAKSSFGYTFISCIISVLCAIAGLISSFYFGFSAGATIVLFNAILFVLVLCVTKKHC